MPLRRIAAASKTAQEKRRIAKRMKETWMVLESGKEKRMNKRLMKAKKMMREMSMRREWRHAHCLAHVQQQRVQAQTLSQVGCDCLSPVTLPEHHIQI